MQTSIYSQDYARGIGDVKSIARVLSSGSPTQADLSGALEKATKIDTRFGGFEHRGLERELLSLLDIRGGRSGSMPYRVSKCQLAVVVSDFVFLHGEGIMNPLEMLRSYPYLATHSIREATETLENLGFRDPLDLLKRQCELVNARYSDSVAKKLDYYGAYGIDIRQLEIDSELLLLDFDKTISPRLRYINKKAVERYGVNNEMELGISPKDVLVGNDDDFVETLQRHGLPADILEFREFAEKPHGSFPLEKGLLRKNGIGAIFNGNRLVGRPAMIHPTQVDDAPLRGGSQQNAIDAKRFAQIEVVARVLTRKRLQHALAVDAVLSAGELDRAFSGNSGHGKEEAKRMLLHGLGLLESLDPESLRYVLGCSLFLMASNFAYLRMAGFDDAAEQLRTHRYLARYDIKKAVERLDSVGFRAPLEMLLKHWRLAELREDALDEKIDYLSQHNIWLGYLEKHPAVLVYSARERMMPRLEYLHAKMAKTMDDTGKSVELRLDPACLLRASEGKFIDILRQRNLDVDDDEYRAFAATCARRESVEATASMCGTKMIFTEGSWTLERMENRGGHDDDGMRSLLRNAKG